MQIQKLSNCNVYGESGSYEGVFSEVTVPETKQKAQEHKSADMIGTRRISGPMEPMECTLKADGFYEGFHGQMGDPDKVQKLQVRANVKVTTNDGVSNKPAVLLVQGWCSSRKVGTLKAGEPTNPEYKLEVHYFKLTVDGTDIEEVDIDNHIHRVKGVDLLAAYRANLGIGG